MKNLYEMSIEARNHKYPLIYLTSIFCHLMHSQPLMFAS